MKCVVAVDREWGIGYRDELLAHVRADLRNFSSLTTGKVVVLGSRTLATFPGGRILKNRTNVILSRQEGYAPEGALVASSVDALMELLSAYPTEEVWVIGGASVYRQLLPYCDTVFVTKFDRSFQKDVFFPNLDESPEWKQVWQGETQWSNPETDSMQEGAAEGPMAFCFLEYRRV